MPPDVAYCYHTDGLLRNQNVIVMFLLETFIAAQESRDTAFEVLVKNPWIQKGKTSETMQNYYDMKTRGARARANEVLEQLQKKVAIAALDLLQHQAF
jgi:hypothetical protein